MDLTFTFKGPRLKHSLLAVALCCTFLMGCSVEAVSSWVEELQRIISPLPSPAPTLAPTSTPVSTPTLEPTATPASSTLALRFWVPDFLDPAASAGEGAPDATGAGVLRGQVADFARMSPVVQVEMLVKKASGAGGLYDLLSTAYGVAPSIVPDLLVLGRQDLLAAAGAGLVQPLDAYLPPDAAYFEAALSDMQTPEGLWAFPYVATAEQMAYRSTVTTTAPVTWTGVLSNSFSLVLPGTTQDAVSTDMLLAMYIGAGGRTVDTNGQATLNRSVLEQMYAFLLDAQTAGLLNPEQALALDDTEACWEVYQQGGASLAPVPVGTYWRAYLNMPAENEAAPTPEPAAEETATPAPVSLPADTLPTWVPTVSGQPVTVMRTWGLAIVTQDPARREVVLELLRWLVSAQQMADLTQSLGLTPTRRQAVQAWDLGPEEQDFVLQLLSNAVTAPDAGADLAVRRALQAGLIAILQGEATTPDAAASQALTSLRR
ncbi:MAG: extracellular solute-binding protein [Anaerolineae bacterium]|nr:extracellular solute-binding protein [Anaerolineae bacterium]